MNTNVFLNNKSLTRFIAASAIAMVTLLSPLSVFAERAVPVPESSNKHHKTYSPESDPDLIQAVNYGKFEAAIVDGGNTKTTSVTSDTVTTASVSPVAVIRVFADGTSNGSGSSGGGTSGFGTHAFITVKNVSTMNITVGKFGNIAPGKTMSIGTWGNKTEHVGLWYNLEAYFVNKYGYYANRVSTSYIMTASELTALNSYIVNNDSWTTFGNCSTFAASAWNTAVSSPYGISAGVPNTPANLATSIKNSLGGYTTGFEVPWNYIVYYAQGTGSPIASTIYK